MALSSLNDNVLWNTEPPSVVQELPPYVTFYANEFLKLQCNIIGNPKPTFQWYVSIINSLDRLVNIHEQTFEKIASAKEFTLVIDGKETKGTYFKHLYFCSAQNPLGTLHSRKIVVEKVSRPSSVSVKYIFDSVYEGEKFVAKCYLVPDYVPLYKFKCWEVRFKSGTILYLNETVNRYSVILSTKFPQLHIRNVTKEDFYGTKVRCIYKSTIDQQYDVINSEFRPIEKFSFEDLPYLKKLSCNGETVTAYVGTNIELPWCSVPRTLNVSWYKIDNIDPSKKVIIGKELNDEKYIMISRRFGNLKILNVTKNDAGRYLVKASSWPMETIFTLNVYDVPKIFFEPKYVTKKLTESVKFSCNATFTISQFLWLHNGLRVVNGYDDGNVEVISTDNTSLLRVKKMRISVSGVYQCIASSSDALMDYKQSSGTLLLSEQPPIVIMQSPKLEVGFLSSQVYMSPRNPFQVIECKFAANPIPQIDWYHDSNKVPITKVVKVDIQRDNSSIYNFIARITIDLNEIDNEEDNTNYAGEYRAKAVNNLGSTSCNTFVLMDGDMEIRLPQYQMAVGDKDYLMICYFKANGIPEFIWDRKIDKSETWESLPVNHRTHLIENGHMLLLKNVIKTKDEGVYRCTMKYNKETKSANTRLTVAYPPILQMLPSKHDSSQSQTHICTIKSVADKPWYAWWTFSKYSGNTTIVISPNMKSSMFSVYYKETSISNDELLPGLPDFLSNYPNLGVDLYVNARSNDKDSFGKFVCHVKNHIGSDEKTIEDNFLRLEFDVVPPSSSEVVVGDDLYLYCSAKESDLKPCVKWRLSKDDTVYTDINDLKEFRGRIFQYDNGTLVMRNIKENDPSKLVCFIFPSGKSDKVQSKIAYIEIRVPARIYPLEPNLYKVDGTSFNLSCNVIGHTQNLMVSWYHRPSPIGFWRMLYDSCIYSNDNKCVNPYQFKTEEFTAINEVHNRTYHTVHLQFKKVTDLQAGQYKCEARNKYNVEPSQTSTTLTIISKPSTVIPVATQNPSTSTSISVDWIQPNKNGNRPILEYIIKYHELSDKDNNKNISEKVIKVNESVHSLVIDHLRPYRKYKVVVQAENEVGVSEPTAIFLQTQEEKPQKPVNNLVASSTKPDEILVSWDDPDIEYQNGHIVRYQICFQALYSGQDSKTVVALDGLNWPDNSANIKEYSHLICKDTDKKMVTVSKLPQFTDYAIRVLAINSKGASPPLYIKVRTLEDLPQAPPSMVTCKGQHQFIELTWNPPGRQTINGILTGYAVNYYEPNKFSDESGLKRIIVHGRTNVVIDQLKPYTSYSVQVMAVNRKGFGPPSGSVFCTTKESKPEAPVLVKAVRINNTCLFISWLHTLNPNGYVREYCVLGFGFNFQRIKCQSPDMNKRYNTMIICDPHQRYSGVKVYAKNQYEGAPKEVSRIEEINNIISIGGDINVKEGSSIILPCEVESESYKKVYWKRDDRVINDDDENIKIFQNHSIQISNIERYKSHSYSCSTEIDRIDYQLHVLESPDGIPKIPIIDDYQVTENSIFICWKSQGTSDMVVPITGFIINWENLYTKDSKIVTVDAKTRSFYLNNVTCASDFIIKVCSTSGNGNSKFSDSKRLRTLGSVPKIADSTILLAQKNISSKNVTFNLLAFIPGDNCSAMYFTLELSVISISGINFNNLIYNKNISAYDLENKCCYKVGDLHPLTSYGYRITAHNPAGSTHSFNTFETLGIDEGAPEYRQVGTSTMSFTNHSWILMIILIIIIIVVLIVVVGAILCIWKSKEQNSRLVTTKNRIDKLANHDDTTSIGSELSPYAVYQPDNDQKPGKIRTRKNSNSQYNYAEHQYNQIRYDKIPGRLQMALDKHHDKIRRANSAECLSSVGNASITGIPDLESPIIIESSNTQEYFRAPLNHCADTDDVFKNIRDQDLSTRNRKRMRWESENLNHCDREESSKLMKNKGRYYETKNDRSQPYQQQMLPLSKNPSYRPPYCQQMSMPEPISTNQHHNNRNRAISGSGQSHPSSQTVLHTNTGSSAQISGRGSFYGQNTNDIQPYASMSAIRREEASQNLYSPYVAGNNASSYNPPQRNVITTSTREATESPEEGIYTDRVIVV